MSKLIGKIVFIINKGSSYYDEWGIIKSYDDGLYHIAIADGFNELVFNRDEFRVPRNQKYYEELFVGS